jgi:hypothetical protein
LHLDQHHMNTVKILSKGIHQSNFEKTRLPLTLNP